MRRTAWCLVLLISASCSREPDVRQTVTDSYEAALLRERREKDAAFRDGSASPIPAGERARFRALDYYPPNPALRFERKLQRYPSPQRLRMATNTGEMRDALRYGWFDFEIDGTQCRLQAYRMEENEPSGAPLLFIPFRDATSGNETYAAGRYLEMKENTSGVYDLDFNRAFNPYCAYGGNFSCPAPPRENWLPAAVRAGEKNFSQGGTNE